MRTEILEFFDFEVRFQVAEHYGYLRIPTALHQHHSITVKSLTLDPHDSCFGGPITQYLLKYFVGYDTVIFHNAAFLYWGTGYFMTKQTHETYNIGITLASGSGHPTSEVFPSFFFIFLFLFISARFQDSILEAIASKLDAITYSTFMLYSVTGAVTLIFQGTQLRMLRTYSDLIFLLFSLFFFLAHGLTLPNSGCPTAAQSPSSGCKVYDGEHHEDADQHDGWRLSPFFFFSLSSSTPRPTLFQLLMATMLFVTQFTEDPIIGFFVVFLAWCSELFTFCS